MTHRRSGVGVLALLLVGLATCSSPPVAEEHSSGDRVYPSGEHSATMWAQGQQQAANETVHALADSRQFVHVRNGVCFSPLNSVARNPHSHSS
jgi:hypothetical protein